MSGESFQAHLELLHLCLARRDAIVERLQGLLNAQRKPVEYLQHGALLSRGVEDAFFIGVTLDQARLRGRLEGAHWASGFTPRELPGLHNGLVDPGEMIVRAFHLWRQTRWPGRGGRVHYAHTLFNLYVIRALTLSSMRVWDDGADRAGDRLSQVQGVLDRLWTTSPADQPVFLRDARWLIPMAQSPATDDLGAYFGVAEKVAGSFPEEDRIEIHTAGVRMAAGHLRSQIRYYALNRGVAFDEKGLVATTRTSNALDFALLIQELVPLLDAYERADGQRRIALADAICQGLSPDPELFVNRVELLGAYSMIEHLFITAGGEGHPAYTPMGERHVRILRDYQERIGRVSTLLAEDCERFRPAAGSYSPYGVIYGFSSDLLEHMALKATQPDAVTPFGLEDVFAAGDTGKLAWVSGWRKLPHLAPDVTKRFDYPQQFAEDVFARLERAVRRRVAAPTGRIRLVPDGDVRAVPIARSDREEGKCLVSYPASGGWVGISKAVLTDVLGEGRDATIAGVPPDAAETLALMCPGLVAAPGSS